MEIVPNNVLIPQQRVGLTTYVVDLRSLSVDQARTQLRALAVLQTLYPVFRVAIVSSEDVDPVTKDLRWPVEFVPSLGSLLTSVSVREAEAYLERRMLLMMTTYNDASLVAPSPHLRELGAAQIVARKEGLGAANILGRLDHIDSEGAALQGLEAERYCAGVVSSSSCPLKVVHAQVGSEGFLLVEGVEGQFGSLKALPAFGLSLKVVEYRAKTPRHQAQCLHSELAANYHKGVRIRLATAEADSLIGDYGAPFDLQEMLTAETISESSIADAITQAASAFARSLLVTRETLRQTRHGMES